MTFLTSFRLMSRRSATVLSLCAGALVGCADSSGDEARAEVNDEIKDATCSDFPDAGELGIGCVPASIKGRSIATNVRKVAPSLYARMKGWEFWPYGVSNEAKALPQEEMSIRLAESVMIRPSFGDPNFAIWHRAGSSNKVFATAGLAYLKGRDIEFHIAARMSKDDFDTLGTVRPRPLKELAFDGHKAQESIDGILTTATTETLRHFADFRAPSRRLDDSGEPRFAAAMINDGMYYLTAFYRLNPANSYESFAYFLQALQDASM